MSTGQGCYTLVHLCAHIPCASMRALAAMANLFVSLKRLIPLCFYAGHKEVGTGEVSDLCCLMAAAEGGVWDLCCF